MNVLDFLYLITSMASLIASAPQVRQLFREKRSEELNITTWFMWFVCQITFLIYVGYRGETLMLITNLLWLLFYGVMLYMILYYRYRPGMPLKETALDTIISDNESSCIL